jgi:hypothetical protein
MKTEGACIRGSALWAVLATAALLSVPAPGRAAFVVAKGFDLFQTAPGTQFQGIPFQGVPIGQFDFGGNAGIQNVGNADTIVQRLGAATSAGPRSLRVVPIIDRALQLVSSVPVPQFGNQLVFATLQSTRGGPLATGRLAIHFKNARGGFFNSSLTLPIDLRVGGLNGPIVLSTSLKLKASRVAWTHFPPAGARLIPGVNFSLKNPTKDPPIQWDFWPAPFGEIGPGETHNVLPAAATPSIPLGIGF